MKGTKLWQAAGSPIIQGRSRRQRPFWQEWLPAWVVAIGLVIWYTSARSAFTSATLWSLVGGALGALLGAMVGVLLGRAMGWRFPWFWGVLLGLAGAAALMPLTVALLS